MAETHYYDNGNTACGILAVGVTWSEDLNEVTCRNCQKTHIYRYDWHKQNDVHYGMIDNETLCGLDGSKVPQRQMTITDSEVTCRNCKSLVERVRARQKKVTMADLEDLKPIHLFGEGVTACGLELEEVNHRCTTEPYRATCPDCLSIHLKAWTAKKLQEYNEEVSDAEVKPTPSQAKVNEHGEVVVDIGGDIEKVLATHDDTCCHELSLPPERQGRVIKFRVDNWPGYVIVTDHEGQPAEVFIHCAKEGSTIKGFLDALAISISIGLRAGVDPARYVKSLAGMRFDPQGYAQLGDDQGIQVSSIVDALMRILIKLYPTLDPEAG
jgi:hypothetical protein